MSRPLYTRNSLRYWLPHVRALRIPHPRTVVVPIGDWWSEMLDGKAPPDSAARRLQSIADQLGYPLFVRTDYMSGKHDYDHACHLACREDLFRNIYNLFEAHGMAFMVEDPTAICFREWLTLDAAFKSFDGLPIAREWRLFANGGVSMCQHPYWPEEALAESWRFGSVAPAGWRDLLAAMYEQPPPQMAVDWALRLTRRLGGAWSVDVACDKDGRWWLIDTAEADRSWHPAHEEETAC